MFTREMHFHRIGIWTFIAKCTRAVVPSWKWPSLNWNVHKQFFNTDLEAKSCFDLSAILEPFELPCFENEIQKGFSRQVDGKIGVGSEHSFEIFKKFSVETNFDIVGIAVM
jgi:hypothetical protein